MKAGTKMKRGDLVHVCVCVCVLMVRREDEVSNPSCYRSTRRWIT